jgi:hypothetical protein
MGDVIYFKRYRMEIDLPVAPEVPVLPIGYEWCSWSPALLDVHADVKYRSFRGTVDTDVFPSLAHPAGCRELMRAISTKADFVAAATWLIVGPAGPCGTVQGLRDRRFGFIQNLGIVPEARGLGLGTALLFQSLAGFRRDGLKCAYLEVTARNESAVRLYRRLGFRARRTIYKGVMIPTPLAEPVVAGAGVAAGVRPRLPEEAALS